MSQGVFSFGGQEDSLQAARNTIIANREKGIACPCCGSFCKVYRRPICVTMACDLIAAYRLDKKNPGRYWHVSQIMAENRWITGRSGFGDFPKFVWWGLAEEAVNDDFPHKRTSGFWRINENGRAFVEKRLQVPRHAYAYQNTVLGFGDEQIDIAWCLKKRFDYGQLMDGTL